MKSCTIKMIDIDKKWYYLLDTSQEAREKRPAEESILLLLHLLKAFISSSPPLDLHLPQNNTPTSTIYTKGASEVEERAMS